MSSARVTLQNAMEEVRAGRLEEAQHLYQPLLEAPPGQEHAEAWHQLALLIDETGDSQGVIACLRKAIEGRPDFAEAHNHMGLVLDRVGETSAAIAEWKEAARLRPDWLEPQYYLSAANHGAPPSSAPARYVAKLFDKYSQGFDDHLLRQLEYKVPDLIAAAVARAGVRRAAEVIDLGCGTGLCGLHIRPLAGRMIGVDLSPKMIEKARQRNIYDELAVGDLMEVLKNRRSDVDLILAADVFVYVGELTPLFAVAQSALRPGGIIAFSVEKTRENEPDLVLRESRRFSHSRSYIQRLIAQTGLEMMELSDAVLRLDGRDVIEGMIVVAKKAGV
jgi:predicted TPR repeat methyltransferase